MSEDVASFMVDWPAHQVSAPVEGVKAWMTSGAHLTLALYELDGGVAVPEHTHEVEEAGYVLAGELELIAGGSRRLGPGEAFLIPAGVPHAARALEAGCRLLECYAPPRTP